MVRGKGEGRGEGGQENEEGGEDGKSVYREEGWKKSMADTLCWLFRSRTQRVLNQHIVSSHCACTALRMESVMEVLLLSHPLYRCICSTIISIVLLYISIVLNLMPYYTYSFGLYYQQCPCSQLEKKNPSRSTSYGHYCSLLSTTSGQALLTKKIIAVLSLVQATGSLLKVA